jgi:hypothetical protein
LIGGFYALSISGEFVENMVKVLMSHLKSDLKHHKGNFSDQKELQELSPILRMKTRLLGTNLAAFE